MDEKLEDAVTALIYSQAVRADTWTFFGVSQSRFPE